MKVLLGEIVEQRPEGYPYGEFDALKWAEEFKRIYPEGVPELDTMLGWFANAIMTGYDKAKNEGCCGGPTT